MTELESLYARVDVEHGVIYRRKRPSASVILFVHGVKGSPDGTWRMFPEFMASSWETNYCDIALFKYDTPLIGAQATVKSVGTILKGWIEQQLHSYKHISILAHSLGGLVAKQAILDLYNDKTDEAVSARSKLRRVFLYAVPHGGSRWASLLRLLTPWNRLARELSRYNKTLAKVNEDLAALRRLKAREGRKFPTFKAIIGAGDFAVARGSALPPTGFPYVITIDGGHRRVTKPSSPNDSSVVHVRNELGPLAVLNPLYEYLLHVPQLLEAQAVTGRYVVPSASVQPTHGEVARVPNALDAVEEQLAASGANVLVTAEYGMGKTSFAYMLGGRLARRATEEFPDATIPVFVSLAFARSHPSITEATSKYLKRYGIDLESERLEGLLRNKGNIAFLLDGVDEMVGRTEFAALPGQLAKLDAFRVDFGARTLLTCRSTFFRDDAETMVLQPTCAVRLDRFSVEQIGDYLRLRVPDRADAAMRALRDNDRLLELCARPIHLMLFSEYVRSAVANGGGAVMHSSATTADVNTMETSNLDVAELYSRFVDQNLADHFAQFPLWSLSERRRFIQDLAFLWFAAGTFEWEPSAFKSHIKATSPQLSEEEGDRRTTHLLNCSFFMRVDDKYRFLHPSFLEFFVSAGLAEDILRGDTTRWETPLYTEIYEFMYHLIGRKGFGSVPFDDVLRKARTTALGNFLATTYRHRVPGADQHLRTALRSSDQGIIRCVAMQGLGIYAASRANAEAVCEQFDCERNGIVRAMIQLVVSHWGTSAVDPDLRARCESVLAAPLTLDPADAEDILRQAESPGRLRSYRHALRQGDALWSSCAGAILNLALAGDKESFASIRGVVGAARSLGIRRAYELVRERIETGAVAEIPLI